MLHSSLGAFADLVGALDAVDAGTSVGLDPDRIPHGVLAAAGDPIGTIGSIGRGDRDGRCPEPSIVAPGFGPEPTPGGDDVRSGEDPIVGTRRLSALVAGPTACDLLVAAARGAADGPRALRLVSVDFPTVVLHQVLDVSRTVDAPVRVAWAARTLDGNEGIDRGGAGTRIGAICRAGMAHLEHGAPAGRLGAGPAHLSIHLAQSTADTGASPFLDTSPSRDDGQGAEIDYAVWHRLRTHAERRLVEGDERSRLTGAGAGVLDTD